MRYQSSYHACSSFSAVDFKDCPVGFKFSDSKHHAFQVESSLPVDECADLSDELSGCALRPGHQIAVADRHDLVRFNPVGTTCEILQRRPCPEVCPGVPYSSKRRSTCRIPTCLAASLWRFPQRHDSDSGLFCAGDPKLLSLSIGAAGAFQFLGSA